MASLRPRNLLHILTPLSVKKVRLSKTPQNDKKIEREVDALSGLFHRNIVRYYTTWFEVSDPTSAAASGGSSTESSMDDEVKEGLTSVPGSTSEKHLPINGQFQFNVEDFDDLSVSHGSFPSIHFSVESDSGGDTSSSSEDDDGFGGLFKSTKSKSRSGPASLALNSLPSDTSAPQTTLYIQMVRQSLSVILFTCSKDFLFLGVCGTADVKRSEIFSSIYSSSHI